MGNLNFQDVIRDVHDPTNHALQISGTISAAGQATITLTSSPAFIGIVTVANQTAASLSGNVTLNPSPNFIGIVTVANSQTNTGNVTLNGGPNQIGSVTVSNPITIGNAMVTVTLGTKLDSTNDSVSLPANTTVIPGSAWTDPKTYIGLVTATMAGSVNTGMTTIFPGPNFIGLTTAVIGSAPTLFAVVNTAAAGQASVALDNSIANIGFATVYNATAWPDPKTYIGLVTASGTVGLSAGVAGIGFATVNIANGVGIVGNLTLSDAKTYVGLVSVSGTVGLAAGITNIGFATVYNATAWPNPNTYIGLVTIGHTANVAVVGNITLSDSKAFIGLNTVVNGAGDRFMGLVTAWVSGIAGNITLSDSKGFIGLNTVVNGAGDRFMGLVTAWVSGVAGNITLSDAKTYVGLTTTTLGVGTQFVGLVTANAVNVGTNKTLVILPVGLGNNSLSTVAVPTNAQRIKVTSMVLNSNVTTEIALKSGVTYLTGNASLGITLFPGGGFVLPGSPDSPQWISLPSGALVIEKRDPGGTVSKTAGHVIYFDE